MGLSQQSILFHRRGRAVGIQFTGVGAAVGGIILGNVAETSLRGCKLFAAVVILISVVIFSFWLYENTAGATGSYVYLKLMGLTGVIFLCLSILTTVGRVKLTTDGAK